ncbi:thioesterase II family protein [Streptomyces flavidovirens]|uniref:thioesterase II family protein n=1 Tax=Streptomyces flavidovirens TaxID=67298 RepID=UPI000686EBD1|nr:alpha/beta fold hydrolase [Streptomyces flavidovirens]
MSGRLPPRLFCFHHAGAGVTSFARWQNVLGERAEVVPVLLPGRDARVREPRITAPARLLDEIMDQVGPRLDRPYALYGHSLGALIAYTFARTVEATGLRGPELVVVGAALPPHLPSPLLPAAFPPDAQLLPWLVSCGVLPAEAAEAGEGGIWQRRVLPTIRDDLLLADALRRTGRGPLRTPVLAVAGREDHIAPAHLVEEWRRYAPAGFGLRTVPGGHFFVRDRPLPEFLRETVHGLGAVFRPESSTV